MAVDFNSEYTNLCDWLPFSHLYNREFQFVIGYWSIDPSKLKTDLFDLITSLDKFDECDPDHILPQPSSDYYSVSEMNSTFEKAGSNSLTLFHCNIRSLPKNLSLLRDILYCLDSRPNIVAISETRLLRTQFQTLNWPSLLFLSSWLAYCNRWRRTLSQKIENQSQGLIFNN